MIFQKQTISHEPANDVIGDCYRTCVACILNMKPEDVPHFSQLEYNAAVSNETVDASQKCREWLSTIGYDLISVYVPESLIKFGTQAFGDAYYILVGDSPNYDSAHCVIGQGNCEVIWDVSHHNKGLKGPMANSNGSIGYHLEFIIPKNEVIYG